MRASGYAAIVALVALAPCGAWAQKFEPPFMPMATAPRLVEPDAPLTPAPGDPPGDIAFGAYQRGYFITAFRAATARVAANPRDAAAMTLIGEIYRDGIAVTQDVAEASHWYRLASGLGDPQAAFQLGVILLDGAPGVPRDVEAAKAQFERAGAKGVGAALYNLGVLAMDTSGGRKPDFAAAAEAFRKAAEAGDGNAAYSYGVLLRQGKGVGLDIAEAAKWLKRAADEGIVAGQVEYAIMLFNGVGVTRDEAGAAHLFTLAAGRHNPIAQNRLAHLYLVGRGVPKDLVRVALWNGIAKAAGVDDAELDKATANLSPDDLKEVERLTRLELEF